MGAMLDLGYVRANLVVVEEKLRARGMDPAVVLGRFEELDLHRRSSISQSETNKAQQNQLTGEVAKLRRAGEDATAQTERVRELKVQFERLEEIAATADAQLRELMQTLPNLPQDDVPVGKSEHDNREEKVWGEKPSFGFPALAHWEIGERLGILDFERAAKISGSRFVVHYGQGARLERALANFMLDLHTKEHGYTEVLPPYMVNSKSLFGTGQLPKFAEDLFHCDDKGAYEAGKYQDSDHWMIPTAEVPVTNLFRDETLEEAQLTTSFCAYTPCFRSEAGSYGKDVRGMIRQHQFQKAELVKFCRPQDSNAEHERADEARRDECWSGWSCRTAGCCCARATWDSRRRRRTIWRCGCRDRGCTGRSRAARTLRRSRPEGRIYGLGRSERRRASLCIH
jgi:seryl-tRNA synthetase